MGYTVVDTSTVMVTYLSHVIQSYAHELPGREEVQQLLDNLGRNLQKRVAGRVSETLTLGTLLQVLRNIFWRRTSRYETCVRLRRNWQPSPRRVKSLAFSRPGHASPCADLLRHISMAYHSRFR